MLRSSSTRLLAYSLLARRSVPCRLLSSSSPRDEIKAFLLADIGEGIAEVELLKWFVKEGDSVRAFDRICEVQSDKATVEITSRFDGRIEKLHYTEGSLVAVGSSLVDINTGSSPTGHKQKLATADKQTELVGTATQEPSESIFPRQPSLLNLTNGGRTQATPAVRKLAKENGVDLSTVQGSGPRGRILKDDLQKLVSHRRGTPTSTAFPPSASAAAADDVRVPAHGPIAPVAPSAPAGFSDVRVPVRGVQRLMVKSMTAALEVQHLTLCEEIVLDKLVVLRKELKDGAEARGVKISMMPLLIKATSLALKQFPQLNATVSSPDCSECVHHGHHNIGVAMDTPRGLVVPVLRHIQIKNIWEIATELANLQELARAGALTESHLTGGTFTLSNIGSLGGTYAVPVLVVPQVAIGAFGRMQVLPRYPLDKDGRAPSLDSVEQQGLVPKPITIMSVSWSADHRVIDGATVARFSNTWKGYLEQPHTMLAELS